MQNGKAVAPHALATESAIAILSEGVNAIAAMVAVYPQINSIGGDGVIAATTASLKAA